MHYCRATSSPSVIIDVFVWRTAIQHPFPVSVRPIFRFCFLRVEGARSAVFFTLQDLEPASSHQGVDQVHAEEGDSDSKIWIVVGGGCGGADSFLILCSGRWSFLICARVDGGSYSVSVVVALRCRVLGKCFFPCMVGVGNSEMMKIYFSRRERGRGRGHKTGTRGDALVFRFARPEEKYVNALPDMHICRYVFF